MKDLRQMVIVRKKGRLDARWKNSCGENLILHKKLDQNAMGAVGLDHNALTAKSEDKVRHQREKTVTFYEEEKKTGIGKDRLGYLPR